MREIEQNNQWSNEEVTAGAVNKLNGWGARGVGLVGEKWEQE